MEVEVAEELVQIFLVGVLSFHKAELVGVAAMCASCGHREMAVAAAPQQPSPAAAAGLSTTDNIYDLDKVRAITRTLALARCKAFTMPPKRGRNLVVCLGLICFVLVCCTCVVITEPSACCSQKGAEAATQRQDRGVF